MISCMALEKDMFLFVYTFKMAIVIINHNVIYMFPFVYYVFNQIQLN